SGNFDPKYPLSRGQMAMLMFIVDSGGNRDAKLWANVTCNFTDIDGMFYTNHIKWAYAQGIVGGVTSTQFCPANKLTAIEALGFALGLIGYNRNTEGFFGADWKNKILLCLNQYDNLFLLNKLGHLMGNLGDYISREETAQLIYNMMSMNTVKYENGKAVEDKQKTVLSKYFDGEIKTGVYVANEWADLDGNGITSGSLCLIADDGTGNWVDVFIDATVPIAFLGRELKYLEVKGKLVGAPYLANTDTVVTTTVGAAKEDITKFTVKKEDATWDWDDACFAINYEHSGGFGSTKDDNPVTLVLKGKKVQFALAMNYTYEKITDVKADGTITSASVMVNVKPADIVIGANLAVKDTMVLAAKLGWGPVYKYALVAVEKLNGTCTEFAAGDFYKINGTNYKVAGIDGASMAGFASADLGKATDFYLYNGKLLGSVAPAVPEPVTAHVIIGRSTNILNGIKYYVYDIDSKSEKVCEFVGANGAPADDKFSAFDSGDLVSISLDGDKVTGVIPVLLDKIADDFEVSNSDNKGFVQLTDFVRSDVAGMKLATLTDDATPTNNTGLFNYDGIEVFEITMTTTGVTITASTLKNVDDAVLSEGTNANGALVYIDKGKITSAFIITA
ncbi:MAG: S-layer homology domain-containing protein, partial [Oscillospiraceae bacterium]|nr:S-layer homology domain-containing protein [Oscillospiraceae bacterium]